MAKAPRTQGGTHRVVLELDLVGKMQCFLHFGARASSLLLLVTDGSQSLMLVTCCVLCVCCWGTGVPVCRAAVSAHLRPVGYWPLPVVAPESSGTVPSPDCPP